MSRGDEHARWMVACGACFAGETPPCPRCGAHALHVRAVGDLAARLGFALVWCAACLHGARASRVGFGPHVEARAFDDPAALDGVPAVSWCV